MFDQARRERVEKKARAAIEELALSDLAAAASILRVGHIQVVEDPSIPTAALQREHGFKQARFRIVLNAEFCDRSQRDVTAIMLHELLHHVMRHLEGNRLGDNPHLSNVVEDAFINRTIHLLNPELSGFFSDFYQEDQMPQLLLRPGSKPESVREANLYRSLQDGHLTEKDLYDALQQSGASEKPVQLIGSHGGDQSSAIPGAGVEELLREIGEQLQVRGAKGRAEANKLDKMAEEFLRLRQAQRAAPLQKAMHRAVTDHLQSSLLQKVAGHSAQPVRRSPVMPERPARSDLYWMLAGVDPILWSISESENHRGAVAVYLDVSGSMNHYISTVYECCLAFEEYLATEVYLFSNKVETVGVPELKSGLMKTTYGTDFDCVLEHFLSKPELEKAVLFSDGYAGLDPALQKQLIDSTQEIIGVVTPRGQSRIMKSFCSEVFRMPQTI